MSSPSAALFATTVFASAFLIFFVQPMVAKHILPWFGGAPAVWTLCLAFYQLTLFAGYGHAHRLNDRLRASRRIFENSELKRVNLQRRRKMMSLNGVRGLGIWMACTLFLAGCSTPGADSTLRVPHAEGASPEIARLEQAAESGDPTALSLLAFAYQEGRGVPVDHATAIELHREAANHGEVASQAALGRYFMTGMGGTRKQPHRGLSRLREAAKAGNPDAQALLGRTYIHGYGRSTIRSNWAKAEKWLKAASDQGVAVADYDLATVYYERQEYEQTLERLEKAVAQDQPQAHTLLSTIYKKGYGVAVDDAESVRLLRRAAVLGDPVAQTNLGVALREGSRMTPNARESVEWFEKAAAQGYTEGLVNLGIAYAKGTGVSRDVVRGVAWLEIGRARNARTAIRALGWARDGLTPDQLQAARELQEKLAVGLPKYVE